MELGGKGGVFCKWAVEWRRGEAGRKERVYGGGAGEGRSGVVGMLGKEGGGE